MSVSLYTAVWETLREMNVMVVLHWSVLDMALAYVACYFSSDVNWPRFPLSQYFFEIHLGSSI